MEVYILLKRDYDETEVIDVFAKGEDALEIKYRLESENYENYGISFEIIEKTVRGNK